MEIELIKINTLCDLVILYMVKLRSLLILPQTKTQQTDRQKNTDTTTTFGIKLIC